MYTMTLKFYDLIDVRDIIERIEDLEGTTDAEEMEERGDLLALMEDLKGMGGDEQWQGDWYPITLIRDSYFKTYAQELADDIPHGATWPMTCIDWDQAARELRMDYSSIEIDGVTYWTR